jgi:hypothetical protein
MAQQTRSAREIEADIEHTRAELAGTLDAIEDRLAPESLLDSLRAEIAIYLRSPRGRRIVEIVSNNPVPVALSAIGVGWLAYLAIREMTGHDADRLHVVHPGAPPAGSAPE